MSQSPYHYVNPNLVNVDDDLTGQHHRSQRSSSSGLPGSGIREGDLLYTEKVTKTTTYDARGNVIDIDSDVTRDPPGTHQHDHKGYDELRRSSQDHVGDSSDSYRHSGRMVSDDYGRTGANKAMPARSGSNEREMETERAYGKGVKKGRTSGHIGKGGES